jgi:nitrogen-specific signal transduction histidine kinase/ActR/RegA family two-component response regulator
MLVGGEFIDGTVIDVTDQRKLETHLRQVQKMEAVGRLAGGIAHDFNNLLGVINGYGEMILKRMPAADPLHPKVAQIVKAGERAAGLTRQLLAFSRQQVLQPKTLDLNAVVSEMDQMLRRLIGEDIDLETRLDAQLGTVRADPGQVEQIVMNLAVNARDAMPDGGRLTIETRNVDLDAEYAATHPPTTPGRYAMLAISDTGSGMDAQVQAHIFEPFFTTKGSTKGTGLGLATVYGVVKQSEGFIWVYSEVGVGPTFKIYLPRTDAVPELTAEKKQALAGRNGETALMVEDEAGLRDLLREMLEAGGYVTLVARDGAEALQIADGHKGPIDVLITDVIMPGMTGRAAADVIKEARPAIKVLYLSGYTDEAIIRHGVLGAGAAFLNKPFSSEALLRKVRELLAQR